MESHLVRNERDTVRPNNIIVRPRCVVIGASTGGPDALSQFFSALTPNWRCPLLLVQHMPAQATPALALRLQKASGHKACEATDGQEIEPNQVYVAPGDFHMTIDARGKETRLKLSKGPLRNMVRPSVDTLFESASVRFQRSLIAIVLTGMGRDGFDGCVSVKKMGGTIFAQSAQSSAVFGMPKEIIEHNLASFIGSPFEIGVRVRDLISTES